MALLRWCSSSLIVVGMNIFSFVRRFMSSLSMPPLPSDNFNDSAMESAVLETVAPDSGGTRNKLKFDGVPIVSQKKYPEYIVVARPASRWSGSFRIMIS